MGSIASHVNFNIGTQGLIFGKMIAKATTVKSWFLNTLLKFIEYYTPKQIIVQETQTNRQTNLVVKTKLVSSPFIS